MGKISRYKTTYVLSEKLTGRRLKSSLKFNTFEELKTYLIENTDKLFGWINDDVDDYKDYRELPDFKDVETVRDIKTILVKYNYGWWYITVDTIEVEEVAEI